VTDATKPSSPFYSDALVRALRANRRGSTRLAHALDADVRGLAARRRVRATDDLPLARLVDEPSPI
jgi:hypothetical protein